MATTYAQVSDVRAAMPQVTIDANSRPSEVEVAGILLRAEGDVNGQLANLGYVTPVSAASPGAFAIVKDIVVELAKAATLRMRGAGVDPTQLEAAVAGEKYARGRLKDIADPNSPAELPGAQRTDSQLTKLPEAKFGSEADEPGYCDEPRMRRNQRF